MAEPTAPNTPIAMHDLQGFKQLRKVAQMLEHLHHVGCARDKAGNRELHFDDYVLLILLAMFNPLIEHRQQRVLRRHLPLLEFFVRAASSHARWLPRGTARTAQGAKGLARWYPERVEEVGP